MNIPPGQNASRVKRTETIGNSFEGRRTWTEVTETVEVDGCTYSRSCSFGYRYEDGSGPCIEDDTHDQHFTGIGDRPVTSIGDRPDVICGDCFGSTFKIYLGSYTVTAQCVVCGKCAEVYNG